MVSIKNHAGGSQPQEIMTSAYDLATTVAAYASDRNAIKPFLDQLSSISHNTNNNSQLISNDEDLIFDIYFKLEHYLTSIDPIRNFNKEDLRNKASASLRARLEAYENKSVGPSK